MKRTARLRNPHLEIVRIDLMYEKYHPITQFSVKSVWIHLLYKEYRPNKNFVW